MLSLFNWQQEGGMQQGGDIIRGTSWRRARNILLRDATGEEGKRSVCNIKEIG